jgi:hypothetical protein
MPYPLQLAHILMYHHVTVRNRSADHHITYVDFRRAPIPTITANLSDWNVFIIDVATVTAGLVPIVG